MIKSMNLQIQLLLGLYNWTLTRVELISQRFSVCSMMQRIDRFNDQLSAELLIDAAPPYTVMTLHSFGAMLQQMADITTPSLVTQVLLLSRPRISSICVWVLHIIRFLSNQQTWNYTLTLFAQLHGIILYHHQLDLATHTHWGFSCCLNVFYCFSNGASSPNSCTQLVSSACHHDHLWPLNSVNLLCTYLSTMCTCNLTDNQLHMALESLMGEARPAGPSRLLNSGLWDFTDMKMTELARAINNSRKFVMDCFVWMPAAMHSLDS